ncbi:MAG: EutN/CcmL family microcompartment protein [Ignavibacteria bacterium]|nr:EutN/CcmL family microcompartment protein [Ignavibacteria bacterium]MBT8383587.1 EutN/CcmL family microcompartment protein [Ignavibacteria bacterium]MBT8390671.1 EutN/CcmL family microcompartment protein [Ignavibacteria bacterium]NNJ51729.1 EutN/CcmL family microcompartment protein [Ignavibacteriaceae bacterium]NNL20720.1 EutN/CcmL family microcompartment protein [Ignavibacteriaceae bacterium]
MLLAKVKGNLVSTQKNATLVGHKLLIVHPIDYKSKYIGKKDIVALDMVDAGIGDTVLLLQEGKSVQQILGHKNAPVHSVVVAVVDSIEVNNKYTSKN